MTTQDIPRDAGHAAIDATHRRMRYALVWGAVILCVAPLLLQWLGVDLGSGHAPVDQAAAPGMKAAQFSDEMHRALSGSFTHTILELCASLAAVFTVVFAFAHYSIKRDTTTLLICIALFFAACMDAFHTIAADRLISSSAPPAQLVPFTWALCRFFNAVILLGGTGFFAFRSAAFRPRPLTLGVVGVVLAAVAYALIHVCAVSTHLPVTTFPAAAIKRPYDAAALVLYVIAAVVVLPRYFKKHPSPFSCALWVSAIPQIATQLYMVFGSTALYDPYFNIAHFVKIIAYAMPFLGLLLDYIETHQAEQRTRAELRAHRDQLEETVALRTVELQRRNDAVRLILDNAHDGMLTVDMAGVMANEHSAIVDTWFGPAAPGTTFSAYIGAYNKDLADMFQLGLEEVAADIMPLEITLDQMPKAAVVNGHHFTLSYQPILEDGKPSVMLVILTDVTHEVEHKRETARQEEVLRIFRACQQDRSGFLAFFNEASEIVKALGASEAPSAVKARRLIHTLKGNCAIFGIKSVAVLCHDIETNLETTEELTTEDLAQLTAAWGSVATTVGQIAQDSGRKTFEISDEDHASMLESVSRGMPRLEILSTLLQWKFEPTDRLLKRFAEQATGVARRLGKQLEPVIEDNGLRLCPQIWSPVWTSLAHVVRNAVDHGLEASDVRVAAGKPATGTLVFRTRLANGRLMIEIQDDGRGIAWTEVAAKARAAGLPHATREDLVEALFTDGVSTKTEVSELSGRGVGMAAVREVCRALGGNVEIESEPGKGALVRCTFPEKLAQSSTHADFLRAFAARRIKLTGTHHV